MKTTRLTTKQVVKGAGFLFALMAEKYSGKCTLHQLMVLNALFDCAAQGRNCDLKSIMEITGIPETTARRAVRRLLARGHLISRPDPDDKRRAFYYIGKRASRSPNDVELVKDAFQKRY